MRLHSVLVFNVELVQDSDDDEKSPDGDDGDPFVSSKTEKDLTDGNLHPFLNDVYNTLLKDIRREP